MKEIHVFYIGGMNNAAHFLFVSNMAERAEKDSLVAEKCAAQVAALRGAVQAEDESLQISAKKKPAASADGGTDSADEGGDAE